MQLLAKLKFDKTPEAEYRNKDNNLIVVLGNDLAVLQALINNNYVSWTNTELKLATKLKVSADVIGFIIAKLRTRGLIDYYHIETGRQAAGSGRYDVDITCSIK